MMDKITSVSYNVSSFGRINNKIILQLTLIKGSQVPTCVLQQSAIPNLLLAKTAFMNWKYYPKRSLDHPRWWIILNQIELRKLPFTGTSTHTTCLTSTVTNIIG